MSSDGKEPGAVWQAPQNPQWQLASQAMDQSQSIDQGNYASLPEEHLPASDLALSTPAPIEEEEEAAPTTAKTPLAGAFALVQQLGNYTTFFIIPLAFFLLFSLITFPFIASRPNTPVWPFLILFLVIAVAQGISVYFLGTSNGFWAAATFFGFCLFLVVSCLALAGPLPSLVLFLALIGASILLARSYLHPVSEGYVDIVYRFGKYQRTLSPGLNVILPIEKVGPQLNIGETQWICPLQRVQLSRKEDTILRAAISYKLIPEDAYLAVTEVNQWEESLRQLLISSLQTIATTFMPEDFVAWPQGLVGQVGKASEGAHWDQINAYLFQYLRDRAAMWGVQVNWIRIRDVTLVPHNTTVVDTGPIPTNERHEQAPQSNTPSTKGGGPKTGNEPISQPEDPTQADVPAPIKLPKAEVLVKAYKEVQSGKVTDPATIRSIAQNFVALAADKDKSSEVNFDAERAAENLFEQAKKYEDMYDPALISENRPRSEKSTRKRAVE